MVAELRGGASPLDRPGARVHRPRRRPTAPPRCWSSTGRTGSRRTPTASRTVLSPLVDKLAADTKPPSGLALAFGSRVTGLEVGGLLGFLGGKVLGQFDPFHDPPGRLLLVAPNIVHVERELDVDPPDFRLWVCLHEETHRVQFTAVPVAARTTCSARCTRSPTALELSGLPRGRPRPDRRGAAQGRHAAAACVEAVSSPEQKAIIDRVTGVMSLLGGPRRRGHGRVGPPVIPTVGRHPQEVQPSAARASASWTGCCAASSGWTPRWRSTATAPTSSAAVVDKAGMGEFNAVWERPENLPSKAEIADPEAWITRVL